MRRIRKVDGRTAMTGEIVYDVIVVGYGAAGATAALEAVDAGARVLVLDRGYGGGASGLSGGVVYAGGGTTTQHAAGVSDSPENMYRYLKQEVTDYVKDETLRRFCDVSASTITWLESQGARYRGTLCPYKTSYPTDKHYLYYSGNEKAWPYTEEAEPAARGHRMVAKGMSSGHAFMQALMETAQRKGVEFRPQTRVHSLIIEDGRVAGVRCRAMDLEGDAGKRHKQLTTWGDKFGNWLPPLGARLNARAEAMWQQSAVEYEVRGKTVVLAAGGFVYNPDMKRQYEGDFADIVPLGTVGDDGTSIRLGQSAGGTIDHMDRMTAWRFMSPPSGLLEGVSVGLSGRRIANEDLYGATHSEIMIREHGAKGRLILDSRQWKKAASQIHDQTLTFQRVQAYWIFTTGHVKAPTIEQLAAKTGVDPAGLSATVAAYNEGIRSGTGDPGHKAAALCSPIETGPFYAVDISIKNSRLYPASGLTLGGLRVNEETGELLDEHDQSVPGIYAAGRTAVGICSRSYVSGLSLADCVFSGRRAGVHAAATAKAVTLTQADV
ncbi:MAG TPA: FAD-binding protein [Amycolatopsis sp.]|nr:FAD-binding protein [Amycolatopsis sp.]